MRTRDREPPLKMTFAMVSDLSSKTGQRHRRAFDLGICNARRVSRRSTVAAAGTDFEGNEVGVDRSSALARRTIFVPTFLKQ